MEGEGKREYDKGFSIADIFPKNTVGFVSAKDFLNISFSKNETEKKVLDLQHIDEISFRIKYKALKDSRDWKYDFAKKDSKDLDFEKIIQVTYRPFDSRTTYYTGVSRGLYASPQAGIFTNFINKENLGLVASKINRQISFGYFFVTNKIMDFHILDNAGDSTSVFPLYIYLNNEKIPNINKEIWNKINEIAGETSPENILDYIYAVLHSPIYREKYKEFLKTDFPKVPFSKDKKTFFELAKLGEKLRNFHLMNDRNLEDFETKFDVVGDNVVEKIKYENKKVFINEKQYFENVPEVAWNFYIGGYQPAQKWLKDRKGRTLDYENILHYQKIIKVLIETEKIMGKIGETELI